MTTHSTTRRLWTLALAACIAATLSLPAAASARLVYDTGRAVPATPPGAVASTGGPSLALPLAGAGLVIVLIGAGFMAFRAGRPRAATRTRIAS